MKTIKIIVANEHIKLQLCLECAVSYKLTTVFTKADANYDKRIYQVFLALSNYRFN